MKTISAKKESVEHKWCVIDAQGQPVGKLAVEIARRLCGKHKAIYTPHIDTGDYVIVVNAEKVLFTGNKLEQKLYYQHSRYPGGLKTMKAKIVLQRQPARILEHAVKGMLPKTKMGRRMYKKMKIYTGPDHPHAAQEPEIFMLKQRY